MRSDQDRQSRLVFSQTKSAGPAYRFAAQQHRTDVRFLDGEVDSIMIVALKFAQAKSILGASPFEQRPENRSTD
jgi:hypothetical protein